MKTEKKALVYIIIASLIASIVIKSCLGATGSYYPLATNDDGFITEVGNHFSDTPYLRLQSGTTDIVNGLRFPSLALPQDAKINNATLFVRTLHTYDAGLAYVSIYGVDENDAYSFNSSGDFTRPFTSNHVNWNVSDVNGVAWHNVSVTEIVQEIISRYGWRTGNDLAFIILTTQGEPRREFASFDNNIAWRPRLEITWDVAPPSPPVSDNAPSPYNDTSEWEWEWENTSKGIDIWVVTDYGPPEFQMLGLEWSTVNAWYQNSSWGRGNEIEFGTDAYVSSESGALDPILCLDPYTLIMLDPAGKLEIYYSTDEFQTAYETDEPNSHYSNLDPYLGNIGSLTLDRQDNTTIHIVWTSPTLAHNGVYNVIYSNFTIDENGNFTWASSYTNITQVGNTQFFPVIYCEEDGTLHVAYNGIQGTSEHQIYYRRRHTNGTWLAQVRVSNDDTPSLGHTRPDILANEETGVALIAWDYDGTNVYWNVVFPNNTAGPPDRDSGAGKVPSMVNDRENNVAQMVYQTLGSNPVIYHKVKLIDNSSSWSGPMQVSPAAQKHFYPDIGIDPINRSLQALWWNDWNQKATGNYWLLGDSPVVLDNTWITNANLVYNYIEEEFEMSVVARVFFIAYPNGTLIDDEPCETLECAEGKIDDLQGVDPEDPETDDYGTALTKNRWKTFVFVVGMVMFLGTPAMGIMNRASIGRWYLILFVSLCGISLLWSLRYM